MPKQPGEPAPDQPKITNYIPVNPAVTGNNDATAVNIGTVNFNNLSGDIKSNSETGPMVDVTAEGAEI